MKNAVLHIGSEKTGTSYIQEFLLKNKSILEKYNIIYPVVDGAINHTEFALNFSDFVDDFPNFRREDGGAYFEKLKSVIESVDDGKTIILSSEHFHSRCTGHHIRGVYDSLLSLNINVKSVVLYFRDQASLAMSGYSTSVLCGNNFDFEISEVTPDNYYFNYAESASCWGDVFGNERMDIRPYNFLPEEGLLFDFLLSVGVNKAECLSILKNSLVSKCKIHEKIDPPRLDIIKSISKNGLSVDDNLIRLIKGVDIESDYTYYDLNDIIFIKSIFDPVNENLCRKFNLDIRKFPSATINDIKKSHLTGKGELSSDDFAKVISVIWANVSVDINEFIIKNLNKNT